jgi:hypothetical protein
MSNQTDNSLIQIFLPIINAGLITDGFSDVIVKQANQPTQQGINTSPTVYFFKIGSKRYGFLGRSDQWDTMSSTMVHSEKQYFESTWQMQALYLQNPATPNQYTASDLIQEISDIMQSDNTRNILNESGIGILRITDIVNPYFEDDRDNFEAIPSIDITFVYENIRTTVEPSFTTYTTVIYPI